MDRMVRRCGGMAAAAAILVMAAPAGAGDRKPRRQHRDDDKVTVGDVVAGVALIGAIALFAGKKKKAPSEVAPPPGAALPAALTRDEAIDACARAAEGEGARLAPVVQTDRIVASDPADEGWFARGFVTLRQDYREGTPVTTRGFRCAIATVGVPQVTFDGEELAALATP